MTVYVASDSERANVEITPDVSTELSVGGHVIHTKYCTTYVEVINNSMLTYF